MSTELRTTTVETARDLLPEAGQWLMRTPTLHKSLGMTDAEPQPCVVVQVNREHLWYMVQFERGGYTECIKVPEPGREEGR